MCMVDLLESLLPGKLVCVRVCMCVCVYLAPKLLNGCALVTKYAQRQKSKNMSH